MNHLSRFLPVFLFFTLSVSFLFGQNQEKRVLTLFDAIGIAKDQSRDALIAKQSFRQSYWNYRNFKADYLPSLGFGATIPEYVNSVRVVTDPTTKQEVFVPLQYISADADLSILQRIGFSGGSISLGSTLQGLYNFGPDSASFNSVPINLSLNQPIFQYNSYKWDKKIKPLEYKQAKQQFLEDVEEIHINTTRFFFNLLKAQVELKIAYINLHNYDTLYQISKGRYQLGKIAENDLLLLELNYLRAQSTVETAQLDFDNALFVFKSFLRIQDNIPIELIPPANIDFFLVDAQEAINYAEENSSDYLDFERRLLEAASGVNRAKLDKRFDANLSASIGLTNEGPNVMDAYDAGMDQTQVVGLSLSIPIYDWGRARGDIKIAESQQEIVRTSVEQDKIDFRQNIFLKVSKFNMQGNQVSIAAKADTVARKNFDVTKGRYLIGKLTNILDLNNAQVQTDNSQLSYYQALQTFWTSYYELRKLTLFDFVTNRPLIFTLKDIDVK
jgi:outer membrane protein TolC